MWCIYLYWASILNWWGALNSYFFHLIQIKQYYSIKNSYIFGVKLYFYILLQTKILLLLLFRGKWIDVNLTIFVTKRVKRFNTERNNVLNTWKILSYYMGRTERMLSAETYVSQPSWLLLVPTKTRKAAICSRTNDLILLSSTSNGLK